MKKFTCLLIVFLSGFFAAHAQTFSVSGNVTDENNMPLLGVNVIVKGQARGTTTDFDGNYNIEDLSSGDILQFSYVGFEAKEITVNNQQTINVVLQTDSESLEEVVVIGYGTQQRKDITGSVSVVSDEAIRGLQPIQTTQALQGTSSGVNVTQTSGAPGAALNINIRGIASNTENGPLVIIDGYQTDVQSLSNLNPSDVESMTILKDAQAAIYGVAGANGVILVTTKTGELNTAPSVSYDTYYGVQETSRQIPLLNATEYALLLNESYANGGQEIRFPDVSELGEGTDFQDAVFQTSPIISHNLGLNGGTEKVTYAVGGSHLRQEGIIAPEKTEYKRSTAKISLGVEISDAFDIDFNTIYTNISRNSINENGLGSILFNALNIAPTFEIDQEDRNGFLGNEIINPLSQIENTFNEYNLDKFNGTFALNFTPVEELLFTSRIGYNFGKSDAKTFSPIVDYGSGKVFNVTRSTVNQNRINDNSYTFDLFGKYEDRFNEDHHVTLTGGMTVLRNWGDGLYATGYDVPNNSWEFADISLTTGISEDKSNDSYIYDVRKLSFFGRLQYDFKGRYLVSAMLRRDSSTRFSPENRTDYFPSVTAGWIISEENFMKDSETISFLKLRASAGILGNDEVGRNQFYRALLDGEATYVLDGQLVNGRALGSLPNPAAKWEEAEKVNLGLDIRLFKNKIDITTDIFAEERSDLLIPNIPVSGIFGTGAPGGATPTLNAGTTLNKGMEFSIKYSDNIGEDFNFNIGYNVTYIDNEVTQVNGAEFLPGGAFGVGQPFPSRFETGHSVGYFYGYKTNGVFQTQQEADTAPDQSALGAEAQAGDIRYVDINGDGVINPDDKTDIGDPIATYTMGLNLSLNYKNFDFSAFTYASLGNDMIRNYERNQPNVNRPAYYLNRWRGAGTSNEVPRVTTGATSNNVLSEFYVEDASYARIQNVQLGYSLPDSLTEKIRIDRLRVYASVNNLYTFTKYKGFDPSATTGEPIGGGIDYGFYPVPRIFSVGVNLNL